MVGTRGAEGLRPVTPSSAERLLSFARDLLRANDFGELLKITHAEICSSVGYRHVWFMVADHEDAEEVRLIEFSGDQRAVAWEVDSRQKRRRPGVRALGATTGAARPRLRCGHTSAPTYFVGTE